jgi:hypothetical protein
MNNFARRAAALFARQITAQPQHSSSAASQQSLPSELSSQTLRLIGGGASVDSPKAGW